MNRQLRPLRLQGVMYRDALPQLDVQCLVVQVAVQPRRHLKKSIRLHLPSPPPKTIDQGRLDQAAREDDASLRRPGQRPMSTGRTVPGRPEPAGGTLTGRPRSLRTQGIIDAVMRGDIDYPEFWDDDRRTAVAEGLEEDNRAFMDRLNMSLESGQKKAKRDQRKTSGPTTKKGATKKSAAAKPGAKKATGPKKATGAKKVTGGNKE